MKKYIILILSLAFLVQSQAQTKLIAHKSHSGSKATFSMALEHNLFDISKSNFGEPPNAWSSGMKLDSLKFLSDSSAVMVCTDTYGNYDTRADTVYHYPIFMLQHNLDSIKTVLDRHYFFQNKMEETEFIGYDNDEKEADEKKRAAERAAIEANRLHEEKLAKEKAEQERVKQEKLKIIEAENEIKYHRTIIKQSKKEIKEAKRAEKKRLKEEKKEERKIQQKDNQSSSLMLGIGSTPNPPSGPSPYLFLFLACAAGILGYIHYKLRLFSLNA